ncbi:MAG: class I SAM-dependent methyltransferase [Verrucomicrobia subdivision 3 bacterium]|nr:class I SAM-dependent methyltransferase [Limisphaerales bacterium]
MDESIARFEASCAALRGGHGGRHFKLFAELQHDVLRPFYGNTESEILAAYQAHAPVHFLRMLDYPVPRWPEHLPEIAPLFNASSPAIVDFGCGLAQTSISLARFLRDRGNSPHLFLADIPVPQLEFLRWFSRRLKLPATIAECPPSGPMVQLSPCDLLLATELFEHLYDPLRYLTVFCDAIKPGGFLLTNIADHTAEFLHVTPTLAPLRQYLRQRDWRELRPNRVFQKV